MNIIKKLSLHTWSNSRRDLIRFVNFLYVYRSRNTWSPLRLMMMMIRILLLFFLSLQNMVYILRRRETWVGNTRLHFSLTLEVSLKGGVTETDRVTNKTKEGCIIRVPSTVLKDIKERILKGDKNNVRFTK